MRHYTSYEAFERLKKDYEFFCNFFGLRGETFRKTWAQMTKEELQQMLTDYKKPMVAEALRQVVFRDIIQQPHLLSDSYSRQVKAICENLLEVRSTKARTEMVLSLYEKMLRNRTMFTGKQVTIEKTGSV